MILLSAAGSGGTNGLIEYMDKERLKDFIGITNDKFKIFSSTIKAYLSPNATDEKSYIDFVNKMIKKFDIKLFIPNSDIEVYVVSKNIKNLNTKLFLPPFEIVELSFDKLLFHKTCEKLNINTPKTFHIRSKDDIKEAFLKINEPILWCRIKKGSGSKHTSKVINEDDAWRFIKHSIDVYDLKIEDFIIHPFLKGDDLAVMSIWKDNKIKMLKMAKRTRYYLYPGESPPNVLVSFYDEKIEKFIIYALEKLANHFKIKLNGVVNLDIKCDLNNTPYITEINAGRFYYNMQLFNSSKNAFEIFLDNAFGKDTGFIKEDPKVIFIREQDNRPTVIKKEIFFKEYGYEI